MHTPQSHVAVRESRTPILSCSVCVLHVQEDLPNPDVTAQLQDAGLLTIVPGLESEFSEDALTKGREQISSMLEYFNSAVAREQVGANENSSSTKDRKARTRAPHNTNEVEKFSGRHLTPQTMEGIFGARSKHVGRENVESSSHDIAALTKALEAHLTQRPPSVSQVTCAMPLLRTHTHTHAHPSPHHLSASSSASNATGVTMFTQAKREARLGKESAQTEAQRETIKDQRQEAKGKQPEGRGGGGLVQQRRRVIKRPGELPRRW